MKKFVRFAGVALLALTISVASCGGDDDPVAPVAPPVAPTTPTPPPPPPSVEVTMAPASQTIGVGGTVVFAVSVSGGVAGVAASWTCASSDPSMATVTVTSAGCAATAVAAGGVTITAVVTKGGATVNTAAGLTITEDTVERASLFIASIKDSDSDTDEDDEVLSERVRVTLDVEEGDQVLMQLSVLVDGVVAVSRTYGGGASVVAAAPEGEEGERAAQQAARAVVLSFDSDDYDTDTGVPDYLNGERTISAELTVVGSDEPLESAGHPHEFDNEDGVHVAATAPSESARASDGGVWYGGPGTTLEITAIMVSYSGSSVDAVTMQGFCGAAAASRDEAPYEFAPDCAGKKRTAAGATPEFAGAAGNLPILNDEDDIFPINLDYAGPTAPVFKVNPNGRQNGWINAAVALTGANGSGAKANGWLRHYADDGVGGYIPQLRYSTTDPSKVAGAREAAPSTELPAESEENELCFIVTAMDLLGNESAKPPASGNCLKAGSEGSIDGGGMVTTAAEGGTYGALVQNLLVAIAADNTDDVKDARSALAKVGIQGGVDITAPTAVFTNASIDEDARKIGKEFIVEVKDNEGGSGIHTGMDARMVPKALTASLSLRDAQEMQCIWKREPSSITRECEYAFDGISALVDDIVRTTVLAGASAIEDTGYYTLTAKTRDMAGNPSEEISRVVLNDTDVEARASLRVTSGRGLNALEYSLSFTLDDNLSVRDYYTTMVLDDDAVGGVTDGDDGSARFRIGSLEQVDAYNATDLTTDLPVSDDITLPFVALQAMTAEGQTPNEGDLAEIQAIEVYTRDQREGGQGGDMLYASASYLVKPDLSEAADGFSTVPVAPAGATAVAAVTTFILAVDGTPASFDDGDEITLTATVTAADNPFMRVYFYALSQNAGDATDPDVVEDWRLLGSISRNGAIPTTPAVGYEYELEIDAVDFFAIVDDDGKGMYGGSTGAPSGRVIAIGVQNDVEAVTGVTADEEAEVMAVTAVEEQLGAVGLVAAPVMIHIDL